LHETSKEASTMKRLCLAAGAMSFAACLAAHAQAPGPAPDAPGDAAPGAIPDGPGDPVAYARQNLTTLRTRLGVAPAQATAWNAFVDSVLNQSRHMQAMQQGMAQAPTRAPDRVARMAEMMRRGAEDMDSVSAALRQLYPQLDPRQQSIVDQEFSRGPGGAPPPA
jgi:hypothetical protein